MGTEAEENTGMNCFVVSAIGEAGSTKREVADLVLEHLSRPAVGDRYEVIRWG